MIDEIFIQTVPAKDLDATIDGLAAADKEHVYHGVYDRTCERGQVKVCRCDRPIKLRDVDRVAYRKIRRG